MKTFNYLLVVVALFAGTTLVSARSFTYNYKGVDFRCTVKGNETIIRSFNYDAETVTIPAQVKDQQGQTYNVTTLDLKTEVPAYKTNTIIIEQGITQIEPYCFYYFRKLSTIYIPASIEKIGKKAFNGKKAPVFKMPASIQEKELKAGLAVFPHTTPEQANHLAEIDLSVYGDTPVVPTTPANNNNEVNTVVSITPGTSDIDFNIPSTNNSKDNTFCLIFANENYSQADTPNVKYAQQDGETFYNYCKRTLGIPSENIRMAKDAEFLKMRENFRWLSEIAEEYGNDANYIIYYAGHGIPDEKGNCKLIPSDVSINNAADGFSLKELYETLGKLTTKSALVVIDACFSGNDRSNMTALNDTQRGLTHHVKQEQATGNVVVLTAASGSETALAYDEKAHGMFSYYLMKKLQETKGDVTYGELYDYVNKEVKRKSIVAKSKKQTPSFIVSDNMKNSWRNIKF